LYLAQFGIFPQNIWLLIVILIPLAIWGYVWKFIGLWFSAKNGEKAWFIVFAFINLAGILELYYLYSRKCWPFKRNEK
jgi:hypothetical protein